jgi:hypothetical protein
LTLKHTKKTSSLRFLRSSISDGFNMCKYLYRSQRTLELLRTSELLGQVGSKGRAPLFLVSKQDLNTSYWCVWRTKNHQIVWNHQMPTTYVI